MTEEGMVPCSLAERRAPCNGGCCASTGAPWDGYSHPLVCRFPVAGLNWKALCVEGRTSHLERGKGYKALPIVTICDRTVPGRVASSWICVLATDSASATGLMAPRSWHCWRCCLHTMAFPGLKGCCASALPLLGEWPWEGKRVAHVSTPAQRLGQQHTMAPPACREQATLGPFALLLPVRC